MFKILTCLLVVSSALAAPGSSKISTEVQSRLQSGEPVNIIVSFVGSTTAALQSVNSVRFADRNTKLNALHDTLVQNAERSQQGVRELLNKYESKSFWISNQIFVRNADADIIQAIAKDPEVSSVDEEIIAHIMEPTDMREATLVDEHQWGVVKIQAPEAWEHIGGSTHAGDGIIIATVDTGVRVTHEALKDNFLGDYGWFDPSEPKEPLPTDRNGHGTHTTGTIAGGKGIGVAPGAKWSACRGCATSACFQSDLLACGEFFTCPTLADGSNPDCSKAPHLVSNSWGGGRGNTWYNVVIDAWHSAEIIPLFSIGNSGPSCNTANSPGDQNVIGVGSTTIDDAISSFSSVGPTTDGRMKPEIAAPGSNVISAYNSADDAYVSLSGTSMACPHAAGTIALLQTRNKNLTYEQAKRFLHEQTDRNLQFSGRVCDGVGDNVFPNHVFGYGRINALKSIKAQTEAMQA